MVTLTCIKIIVENLKEKKHKFHELKVEKLKLKT